MWIDRTQINSIASKVKKVLKKGIKEGKSVEDIISSGGVEEILGYGNGFGTEGYTHYDFVLGEFDGRITKANLDKKEVQHSGCSKIETYEVIFTIEENSEENKVTAFATVRVDWCDNYDIWTGEFVTIKEWELI